MKKTNDAKEWLSDYLRYFLLILAIVLLVGLIILTLKVYQRYDNIQILDEETELLTEEPVQTESESETETETQTESETETETETEPGTETENRASDAAAAGDGTDPEEAEEAAEEGQDSNGEYQGEAEYSGDSAEESTGDYRTILSTCNLRSYPDYGDNVIGELYAGQTVEFLGEEAGWYKVSVNGTVGYIGPKFLG